MLCIDVWGKVALNVLHQALRQLLGRQMGGRSNKVAGVTLSKNSARNADVWPAIASG